MATDDPWSPDDPAVRRTREAIARRFQPPPEPLGRPSTPVDEAAAADVHKAAVGSALARVRSGDRSAVEILRKLLGRT